MSSKVIVHVSRGLIGKFARHNKTGRLYRIENVGRDANNESSHLHDVIVYSEFNAGIPNCETDSKQQQQQQLHKTDRTIRKFKFIINGKEEVDFGKEIITDAQHASTSTIGKKRSPVLLGDEEPIVQQRPAPFVVTPKIWVRRADEFFEDLPTIDPQTGKDGCVARFTILNTKCACEALAQSAILASSKTL